MEKKSYYRKHKRRGQGPWTEQEVHLLKIGWHEYTERGLREKLNAIAPYGPRTWAAIRRKAAALGLPTGVPQGHEALKPAALRTGYAFRALRALLERQGVQPHYLYTSGQSGFMPKMQVVYYDSDEIDDAIARDLEQATVGNWAKEFGVDRDQLYHALAARNAVQRAGKGHWNRFTREDLEAVLADYEPKKRAA